MRPFPGGGRRSLGAWAEAVAARHLEEKGYTILHTNYRCREGEVDIIARKGDLVAFVEVRCRRSADFGTPEESVTPAKKERLTTAALRYMATHPHLPPWWRVDLVAVEVGPRGELSRLEHIEDALS